MLAHRSKDQRVYQIVQKKPWTVYQRLFTHSYHHIYELMDDTLESWQLHFVVLLHSFGIWLKKLFDKMEARNWRIQTVCILVRLSMFYALCMFGCVCCLVAL